MQVERLTEREREVLRLLDRGLTNSEIAQRLGISVDGAKYHVSQILSKLGVDSRREAVAIQRGRTTLLTAALVKVAGVTVVAATIVGLVAFAGIVVSSSGSQEAEPPFGIAPPYAYDGHGPMIGDHWHVAYAVYIGEERQPDLPAWQSGIHSEGDGLIHMEPFQEIETGAGASVSKFFEYGGGVLTSNELRLPGSSVSYRTGDPVPGDGSPGHIYIIESPGPTCVSLDLLGHFEFVSSDYVPRRDQCIRIVFASEQALRNHVRLLESTSRAESAPASN